MKYISIFNELDFDVIFFKEYFENKNQYYYCQFKKKKKKNPL